MNLKTPNTPSYKSYLNLFKKTEELLTDSFLRYLHEEKRFILEVIKPNSRVLEIGCGLGRLFKEIAIKVGRDGMVVGIDVEDIAIEGTKKVKDVLLNGFLIKMDGFKMGFKENSFDTTVLSWNILGNIEKEERSNLLKEVKRVTKPKGLIVGSVYSEYSVLAQIEQYMLVGSPKIEYHPKFVIRAEEKFKSERFSKKELIDIFKTIVGLSILEISKICPIAYGFLLEKT